MEKLQEKAREKGERACLSGCALVTYGEGIAIMYGIFSEVIYANLIAKRTTKKRNRQLRDNPSKFLPCLFHF